MANKPKPVAVANKRQKLSVTSIDVGSSWDADIPGGSDMSPGDLEKLRMVCATQYQALGKDLQQFAGRLEKAREAYRKKVAAQHAEKWQKFRSVLERERTKLRKIETAADDNGFEDPASLSAAVADARQRTNRYLAKQGIDHKAIKSLSRKTQLKLRREWAKLIQSGHKEVQR